MNNLTFETFNELKRLKTEVTTTVYHNNMNSHLLVLRVREVHRRGHGHWACSGVLWLCGSHYVTPAAERCLGVIPILPMSFRVARGPQNERLQGIQLDFGSSRSEAMCSSVLVFAQGATQTRVVRVLALPRTPANIVRMCCPPSMYFSRKQSPMAHGVRFCPSLLSCVR